MAAPHPFRIHNFRAYWVARFCTTIGFTALTLVLGWQVYGLSRQTMSIHDAAFQLGLIGAVQFVPLLLLTPIVGLVADSFDRRWIARTTTSVLMATAGLLAWLSFTGGITLPILFGAAAVLGVTRAFAGPAYSALAPNLVPRESLPTAIALSSIAWQVGSIAGPSLGGALLVLGPQVAYGTSATLMAIALVAVFLIGAVPHPPVQTDRRPLTRIIDGFAYVRSNRLVLATITLDLFAVLLAGATALLPVYARDILHVGPHGLGLLSSAMGAGAAVVAVLFSVRPLRHDVGNKMLLAVIIFGAAILCFGLSRSLWLSVAALAVAGAADMVSVYIRQSLIQLHTPDDMRGRVGAVSQLTISASNELGEFESGMAAWLLGPVGAVVAGGAAAIAITLAWARLFPELRLAKTFDPPENAHPQPAE